ncbi:MAG: hypothetical protein SLAVMIC_00930 [uncultured marine phage]|uniref:Uncharacterized protein n=1 Tax=uncultured marine phage TaxID=707152 RepID=A0A8D9FSJ4_9VIRU|nr:MAG: hypothetical protein SLAVMIC_00930 [uncultured marine phage]
MRVSKFIKIDPNVLFEYIYDDQNLIGEDYKVLVNATDEKQSFMSGDLSGTKNIQDNSTFQVDVVENRWGLVDTDDYNFLQTKDYAGGLPVRYDIMKIHFPINYTFNEYLGFNVKVYTLDFDNREFYELSNYFYDITDVNRMDQLGFSSPQLLFQEELWGKNIEVMIPSTYAIAQQREGTNAKEGTINSNLTNRVGLSQTSPIIIEFQFLTKKDVINNVTTYLATSPKTISFPQVPEFENLGVKIQPSDQGDFFEIFGIFNETAAEFDKFITDSYTLGKRYYVQYEITMYEENIRGKSSTFTVTENFSDPIEFRPIIKFSTTTAIIDVEMKLIDQVDNSQISRKASYGMLSNEVAKYSLSLSKIDIEDCSRPKVYNLKNTFEMTTEGIGSGNVQFEQVKVPFPVITDRGNVVAKSDNVKVGKDTFYGLGKLQVQVFPFDNVFKFILAREINEDSGKVEYFDLSGSNNIRLVFKNTQLEAKCELYSETDEVDLENGILIFKLFNQQIQDVRSIFESGINAFYLTTEFNDTITILYSGTFKMYDSFGNISTLNEGVDDSALPTEPRVIPDTSTRETAIITRRRVLKNSKLTSAVKPKFSRNVGNLRINSRRL